MDRKLISSLLLLVACGSEDVASVANTTPTPADLDGGGVVEAGFQGSPKDAGSDSSIAADAESPKAFCPQYPGAAFCADFDTPATSVLVDDGTPVEHTLQSIWALSKPKAALYSIPGPTAFFALTRKLLGSASWHRAHVQLSMFLEGSFVVDDDLLAPGFVDVEATVRSNVPDGTLLQARWMLHAPRKLSFLLYTQISSSSPTEIARLDFGDLPANQWHELSYVLDLTGQSVAATVDGVTQNHQVNFNSTSIASDFNVGITARRESSGTITPKKVVLDNILVELQ